MLNLGQGVANDHWVGRGPGASLEDYPEYVKGCDIVSFDVYPVAGLERKDAADLLWYVPKGVDRLKKWTGGHKQVWNCIECTHISNPKAKATPHQVKAEVWMSLIHGSRGLIYFVHQFQPSFNEHALLDDPEMLAAVSAINHQIHDLAPVLNSPDVPGVASVRSVERGRPDRHRDQAAREDHLRLRRRDEERTDPRHVRDQGIEPQHRGGSPGREAPHPDQQRPLRGRLPALRRASLCDRRAMTRRVRHESPSRS